VRAAAPEPGRRGRACRYCRLTPQGTAATRHSAVMLTRMMRGLRLAHDARKPSWTSIAGAAAASFVPARRATRVNPIEVLRAGW